MIEREALVAAGVAVFALGRAHARVETLAETLRVAFGPIRTALRRFDVPIVGTIAADGVVTIRWADGAKLPKPKVLRPHGLPR